ncbi:DUF4468 domain-containing protein [Larkinella soli]|uniref:DUF4468 domain-containing protein n=1 Tax=Larkinella soli TaxID=1770527 RepID=UPI000FFBB541|nr:DUF4468 domain-containing protein [Larkinella soli]
MFKLTFLLLGLCLMTTAFRSSDCTPAITDGRLFGILPMADKKVVWSEVVDCGSLPQAELFRRARLWAVRNHANPSDVLHLNDRETGDLAGKATLTVTVPRSEVQAGGVYSFRYTFVFESTNRKYRATISHLEWLDSGGRAVPVESYCPKNEKDVRTIYAEADRQVREMLASLQEDVKNYKAY